jgi:branched-chain amino acid aminotransferase
MEWNSVEECDLTLDEAKRADEVFITSSMRDVQGIERWDDRVFSPARPVTKTYAATFAKRSSAHRDP